LLAAKPLLPSYFSTLTVCCGGFSVLMKSRHRDKQVVLWPPSSMDCAVLSTAPSLPARTTVPRAEFRHNREGSSSGLEVLAALVDQETGAQAWCRFGLSILNESVAALLFPDEAVGFIRGNPERIRVVVFQSHIPRQSASPIDGIAPSFRHQDECRAQIGRPQVLDSIPLIPIVTRARILALSVRAPSAGIRTMVFTVNLLLFIPLMRSFINKTFVLMTKTIILLGNHSFSW
jgi:hypothetical protein